MFSNLAAAEKFVAALQPPAAHGYRNLPSETAEAIGDQSKIPRLEQCTATISVYQVILICINVHRILIKSISKQTTYTMIEGVAAGKIAIICFGLLMYRCLDANLHNLYFTIAAIRRCL